MAFSLLALHAFLCPSGFAQSDPPATAQTPPPKDPPTNVGKTTTPAAKEVPPSDITQSRYVVDADLDVYVNSLLSVFSMRGRATDPFGQLQDPNAKPVVKNTVAKPTRRVAPVQATPFADIIRLVKVTMVMPKEKCFLMGSRTIKQGDTLNLTYHGKSFRVEVSSVNSRQIEFRNLENSESASLKLNVLPVGISHGTRAITAPGMIPDHPDSPIELDPANTPNDKSPTR